MPQAYLFGILPTLLCFVDAHHWASLDALRNDQLRNRHIPAWQLWLLRMQMLVVYQIAGLKKAGHHDWLEGYSQQGERAL